MDRDVTKHPHYKYVSDNDKKFPLDTTHRTQQKQVNRHSVAIGLVTRKYFEFFVKSLYFHTEICYYVNTSNSPCQAVPECTASKEWGVLYTLILLTKENHAL